MNHYHYCGMGFPKTILQGGQEGLKFKASLCSIHSKFETSLHYTKPHHNKQATKKIQLCNV